MKDCIDGDAVGSIAIVAMVALFFFGLRLILGLTIWAYRLIIPAHLFKVGNTVTMRRKSLINLNNIHRSVLCNGSKVTTLF